jgi:acyl-CoA thioester hydrolase
MDRPQGDTMTIDQIERDARSTSLETYRATVAPEHCDHLGHMNVQHYFRAVSEGMFSLMALVGLRPTEIRARKMSFAVVHAETDFKAELIAGDVIALQSGVHAIGHKSAEFRHELINVASGQTVMSTTFKCVLLDLERRIAVEVPPDIRDRMTALTSVPGT